MNNQLVWQKYAGKVAWPTIILFISLLIGYVVLLHLYKNGLQGYVLPCICKPKRM